MNYETIGFIGTGNMGAPIARRLLAGGFKVMMFDSSGNHRDELAEAGATAVESAGATATPGGTVISMVPDDTALRSISLAPEGVLSRLGPGGIHVSMSTISPALAEELAASYAETGSHFISAPVLGRPDAAAAGQLSILIAGERHAQDRVRSAMDVIGAHVHDFGPRPAAANAAKLAVNFLILAAIEALAEAGGLADRAGVRREVLLDAVLHSSLFGGAVYNGYGAMIAKHRYQPALFPVGLGIKDARLAEDLAASVGAELPIASVAREHLEAADAAGWAAEDWAVIGRVLASQTRR